LRWCPRATSIAAGRKIRATEHAREKQFRRNEKPDDGGHREQACPIPRQGFGSAPSGGPQGRGGVADLVRGRGLDAVRRCRLYRSRARHRQRARVHGAGHTGGVAARFRLAQRAEPADPAKEPSETFGAWLQGRFATWTDQAESSTASMEVLLPLAAVAFGITAMGIVFQVTRAGVG